MALVTDPDEPGGVVWWTFEELDEHARRTAAWLQLTCAPGDRVLLLYPSGPAFVAALLGCLYAGMVAVPAPVPGRYQHERRRARAIVDDSDASCVLTDSAGEAAVRQWADDAMPGVALAVTDTLDSDPADATVWAAGRETLAVLQYTSGSTADPKGVMVTHGNLLANASSVCAALGITADMRFGGWIPTYHDMGLMGQVITPLVLGASTALMMPTAFLKRPHLWLRMIDRLGITVSSAPNFAYELCARRVRDDQLGDVDLSGWHYAINGSEPIVASALDAFHDRFARFGYRAETMVPCFGMAETTLFVSGTAGRAPRVVTVDPGALEAHRFEALESGGRGRDLVSCGTVRDLDVRIVDLASHALVEDGRVGEVWLRGASVSPGYWRQPAATAATFGNNTAGGEDGFLRTGDLGVLYDDELFVTGRHKETMVIRGRNLYPQDVEHELRRQHRELESAVGAVFAAQSAETGDEVLVITHEVSVRLSATDLAALASGMRRTVAREFGVRPGGVALLPRGGVRRTTSGKIQRTAMRRLYLRRQLTALHLDQDPMVGEAP